MAVKDIEQKSEKLLEPILAENEFELVDVEYVQEGKDWYLRAYIDKEGGITVNDCELVSRAFEVKLDEGDFIPDAYILEVSSPGLTRPLKKERDYKRNLGRPVEVHLYKAVDKEKDFVGLLDSYDEEKVVLDIDGDEKTFARKDISIIRQYFEF